MDRGNYRRGGSASGGGGGGNRGRGQGQGRGRGGSYYEQGQGRGGGKGEARIGVGRVGLRWARTTNHHFSPSNGRTSQGHRVRQYQGSSGVGTAWARPPPRQQGSSGVGTAWARPSPQQQGSSGVGTAWARPSPQQQGSSGVGTAWARPPPQQPQQHGGTSGEINSRRLWNPVDQEQQMSFRWSRLQALVLLLNAWCAHTLLPYPVQVDLGTLNIMDQSPSPPQKITRKAVPVARPDTGKIAVKQVGLLANHFPVPRFNPKYHYTLFADNPAQFPIDKTAYDGEKNIFSAVQLPTGRFTVDCSDEVDARVRSYIFTIKFVAELKLYKLKEYLSGNLSYIPRDILQGMDLVMKENPSRRRIFLGRSFYSNEHLAEHDFGFGVAAYRGFQQSLKPTSGGLALCLDYSVLALQEANACARLSESAITRNFEIGVDRNMTCVWSQALQRWALIDFSSQERNAYFRLKADDFVVGLRNRCRKLGINMEEPAVKHFGGMNELSTVGNVEELLKYVAHAADRKITGRLQMICCLSTNANKGQDQYLANLCMSQYRTKTWAAIAWNLWIDSLILEVETMSCSLELMLIITAARNVACPSIAAVIATINWPAANRYLSGNCPQDHRTEDT
ncbi:hypothetical protein HAX54_042204 [Datura stramonium]|uniref:Argonaute linker 1 domain-containing protein n=1 Tax=Datura stramonium TaxID=4076 RepID=A0ABS8SMB9_DATST|nr:hypothetical protein [Datura stramonium]